jgi:hypothetical protein
VSSPAKNPAKARADLKAQADVDAAPEEPLVAPEMTNQKLLIWMFRFIKPVLGLVIIACLWLTLTVAADIGSTYVVGKLITVIQYLPIGGLTTNNGFWHWIGSNEINANLIRKLSAYLAGLVALQAVFRYMREVANSKMSMNMVYYIREAVYDRLQAVHSDGGADHAGNRALRRRVHAADSVYQPEDGAADPAPAADLDLVYPAVWQGGAAGQQSGDGCGG